MSLEQAIHRQCRRWQPLVARLPPARLFTGAAAPSAAGEPLELPYATLIRRRVRRVQRTSDRRQLTALVVRLSVWDSTLDAARRVADEVHSALAGRSFSAAGVLVQDMKRTAQRETQVRVDRWRIDLDFLTRTETEN